MFSNLFSHQCFSILEVNAPFSVSWIVQELQSDCIKTTLPTIPQTVFHTYEAVFQRENLAFCAEGTVVPSGAVCGHIYANKDLFFSANIVPLIQCFPPQLMSAHWLLFLLTLWVFVCLILIPYEKTGIHCSSSETFIVQDMFFNKYHLHKFISIEIIHKLCFILNIIFLGSEHFYFLQNCWGKQENK